MVSHPSTRWLYWCVHVAAHMRQFASWIVIFQVTNASIPKFSFLIELAIAIKCFGVATSYLIVLGMGPQIHSNALRIVTASYQCKYRSESSILEIANFFRGHAACCRRRYYRHPFRASFLDRVWNYPSFPTAMIAWLWNLRGRECNPTIIDTWTGVWRCTHIAHTVSHFTVGCYSFLLSFPSASCEIWAPLGAFARPSLSEHVRGDEKAGGLGGRHGSGSWHSDCLPMCVGQLQKPDSPKIVYSFTSLISLGFVAYMAVVVIPWILAFVFLF